MEKIKLPITARPKFSFDPITKTTTCRLYYDVQNLPGFIINADQGDGKMIPKVKMWKSTEEKNLFERFADAVGQHIAGKLRARGIINICHVSGRLVLYVEGVAKFNPEDPVETFDKQKGRDIAYTRAKGELIRVESEIISEMNLIGGRLLYCVNIQNADLQTRYLKHEEEMQKVMSAIGE